MGPMNGIHNRYPVSQLLEVRGDNYCTFMTLGPSTVLGPWNHPRFSPLCDTPVYGWWFLPEVNLCICSQLTALLQSVTGPPHADCVCVRRCWHGGGLGAGDGPPHDVGRRPRGQDLGHWQGDESPGTQHDHIILSQWLTYWRLKLKPEVKTAPWTLLPVEVCLSESVR